MKKHICNCNCKNYKQIKYPWITSECSIGIFKKDKNGKLQKYYKPTQYGELCDQFKARK